MAKVTPGESAQLFRFLDVMQFQLADYIAPRDLLNLARTCKLIRSNLLKDAVIWKRALAQHAIATESDPIRHPYSLVILHFTQECMVSRLGLSLTDVLFFAHLTGALDLAVDIATAQWNRWIRTNRDRRVASRPGTSQ